MDPTLGSADLVALFVHELHLCKVTSGENISNAHFDICCRNTSLYLDGELIIEAERFVDKALG